MKSQLKRWRISFLTGLAVVLPAVITLAVIRWLFGTVSSVTDVLLFFVPKAITHAQEGAGPMYWYWSLAALALAAILLTLIGRTTRYYIIRRMISLLDAWMLRLPLLNKIYGTIKQVNEALSSSKKSAFKQVVMIEYPRKGLYTIAFITSDEHPEAEARLGQDLVGVFVATTPNPTTGFLLAVPRDQVVPLDMTVAEGFKYTVSLGSVVPDYAPPSSRVPREVAISS
ncbi:MAG: DUF502 domain-containing protein [Verrucomicrobia bacterium]|nr:DUF502 domain-containing protein [Verrucomicrobiota bacterium]